MTRKHLLLAVVLFLVFGGCYLLFHRASPQHQSQKSEKSEDVVGQAGYIVGSLRKKYPHLQPTPITWFKQQIENQLSRGRSGLTPK